MANEVTNVELGLEAPEPKSPTDDEEPAPPTAESNASVLASTQSWVNVDKNSSLDPKAAPVAEAISHPCCLEDLPRCSTSLKRPVFGTKAISIDDILGVIGMFSLAGKDYDEEARRCRLHVDLLEEQRQLAESTQDDSFYNQSVMETIYLCITHNDHAKAEKLKAKYNVNEKKYWYTKLRALCDAQDWDGVDRLGGSGRYSKVKSPIGFLPFVQELASRQRQDQAAAFAEKLPELVDRVDWLVKLDNYQKAADQAAIEQSVDLLEQIKKRASNRQIIDYINKKIEQLK